VPWSDNAVALVWRPLRCVLSCTSPQLPVRLFVRCGPQLVAPLPTSVINASRPANQDQSIDDTIVQEIHLPASGVMGSCLLCIAAE
jgi:hypothetical protein